ncbi:hypothetical protein CACET_c32050 [Clostridium aceticum]|uniref:Replication-associated protein ORF2/G2P domain-containing protein n=1 Tax=Clostridium aceticum TaxID=84022 RepID=A0A0D8I7B7_9CLOT|nr:hypothetical protein [Clostridium aceticum]AKL96649.1 hypothetical protein CACET_c32050 [Clostridium aceticum]KJF25912.1 hypothetical protein TZ02_16130 [Clostridium aceticum]
MPYREKKISSGEIFEVEIYPISKKQKKQPRAKKKKLTVPKQKNLNNKNAVKHLIRLLNTNFTNADLAVHLTYTEKELPQSEKEARKDVANYIRRIKHYRKKSGLPLLKYIAVIEYREKEEEGKAVRLHHHIVMSGDMDRDKVEELWGKGRANADRLKADEFGYEGLARYISKDPRGNKRWTQSKNLKQPTVDVSDSRYKSKRKIEEIARNPEDKEFFSKLYPGYILNSCKVEVNEITAGIHIYVKMRRLKI